jgi:nucleoside-diphosphate-sugar epimerase
MPSVRLLYIGGTGLISSACLDLAVERGHEVSVLNRGRTHNLPVPDGVKRLVADLADADAVRAALGEESFDAVVQWIGFTPDQIARDVALFTGRTTQYVFISSATVYRKPPVHYLVTEAGTPLANPFWEYAENKIACEERLLEAHHAGFPITIVRPSLTYGLTQVPACLSSWERPYTIIDRMRRGAPVIVPGDGTSLWTLTHNSDFAVGLLGLLGHPGALGEAVHITSDEVLTWNDIYAVIGEAAGAAPRILHVPTDALVAADRELLGSLWGDKSHSLVFDNTKIRTLVPEFAPVVPFAKGIRRTVEWFDADPARQVIDERANALWDRVAEVYLDALARVAR